MEWTGVGEALVRSMRMVEVLTFPGRVRSMIAFNPPGVTSRCTRSAFNALAKAAKIARSARDNRG
jgi:hypothetical protein